MNAGGVVQTGTQYIITVYQNKISNRALVRSCGKINTNRASITNRGKLYKSGQLQLLQIGAVLVITNGPKLSQVGAVIRNWGRIITNRGRYYKLGQLLQIGAQLDIIIIIIIIMRNFHTG